MLIRVIRARRNLAVAFGLVAILVLAAAAPAAAQTSGGWQVAGLVNIGEPTLRVVYDTNVPGSRVRALEIVSTMRSEFWYMSQPGSIAGLMQVGYSDHYGGVQIQLYSNNPYIGMELFNLFEWYGINMTGCWENPTVCPTWVAPPEPYY
jgi:hypothetical protein